MLHISENLLLKYLEANEKYNLKEFINKKIFTVADTPLSYRQINTMDEDRLLSDERQNKQGWRKFSFKEIIFTDIVYELKKLGLKHEQLRQLWETFFKEPSKEENKDHPKVEVNKEISAIAIGCVFLEVEIILTIDSEGEISFYDPVNYALFQPNSKAYVYITLNHYVNELLAKMDKSTFPATWSTAQAVLDWKRVNLVKKEEALLQIIRNNDYNTIRVKKKNGEISLIYGEKIGDGNSEFTPQDLIKILDTKDFQDISIVKRDGKIVNYKVEETYKL